jgi:tagatose 6-phosphate kinase
MILFELKEGKLLMKDLIIVSLSPAVDRNYRVVSLKPGQVHRCENPVQSPGGKGVNVARVLSLLGVSMKLIGFFAGDSGRYIVHDLIIHGIETQAIWVEGETRYSINILDSSIGCETEILEAGPVISAEQGREFRQHFKKLLGSCNPSPIIVFSGGIPRGMSHEIYRELIFEAKERGALTFLDASQKALTSALTAIPYYVKPNPRELSQILCEEEMFLLGNDQPGYALTSDEILILYKKASRLGVPKVALTLAHRGALLCLETKALYAHPLAISPVNTIGCGDCFTAGFAFASAHGYPDSDCLRYAVACASSNALYEQVGIISKKHIAEFIELVKIDEYNIMNGYLQSTASISGSV